MERLPGELWLLPPKPGLCQTCAVEHDAAWPHNQQSMYSQFHFYATHQRWPTWEDAMAHGDAAMQAHWRRELRALGQLP